MIGGLNLSTVTDAEFKYTQNEDRIKWTKNAVPIGQYLIPCIRNIPWLMYVYRGRTTLWAEKPDSEAKFNPVKNSKPESESECIPNEVEIHAELRYEPYYFFGGCVYEILNSMALAERTRSKNIPYVNLRNYVDPTGDIDVKIVLPAIKIIGSRTNNADLDFSTYLLKDNGTGMTDLLDNYIRWIFYQLKDQIERMPLFEKLFENTEAFELSEEPGEAAKADLSVRIGNLWLVRVFLPELRMVKIQLVVKFIDTRPDHILEIVLELEDTCKAGLITSEVFSNLNRRLSHVINGIRLESFSQLIEGNIGAMKERKVFVENIQFRHKFYNHVGRLQYLNKYLTNPSMLQYVNDATNDSFNAALFYLFYHLCKNRDEDDLKLYSHNGKVEDKPYTDGRMMRSLIDNLVKFTKGIGKEQMLWKEGKSGVRISREKVFECLRLSAEGGFKRNRKSRKCKISTGLDLTRRRR
jgi:hypothetical protein